MSSPDDIYNDSSKQNKFINEIEKNNNLETVISPQQLKVSVIVIIRLYLKLKTFL